MLASRFADNRFTLLALVPLVLVLVCLRSYMEENEFYITGSEQQFLKSENGRIVYVRYRRLGVLTYYINPRLLPSSCCGVTAGGSGGCD